MTDCKCGCGEEVTPGKTWRKGHSRRKYDHGATCKVDGCERSIETRGWCHAHFEAYRRTGVEPTERYLETDLERFEAKYKILPSGHWIWTGAKNTSIIGTQYGEATYEGRVEGAHRVAWRLYRGPIPDGLVIDHVCRKTLCVNPDHLQPVTFKDNALRGESPLAANAAKTHCAHGHELAGDNLVIRNRPSGPSRDCRECNRRRARENTRRYRARKRAEKESS